jgi:hypothetical protein
VLLNGASRGAVTVYSPPTWTGDLRAGGTGGRSRSVSPAQACRTTGAAAARLPPGARPSNPERPGASDSDADLAGGSIARHAMPPRRETMVALASRAPSPPGPRATHHAQRSISPAEPAIAASEHPAPPQRERLIGSPSFARGRQVRRSVLSPTTRRPDVLVQTIRAGFLVRFAYSQRARDRQLCAASRGCQTRSRAPKGCCN